MRASTLLDIAGFTVLLQTDNISHTFFPLVHAPAHPLRAVFVLCVVPAERACAHVSAHCTHPWLWLTATARAQLWSACSEGAVAANS